MVNGRLSIEQLACNAGGVALMMMKIGLHERTWAHQRLTHLPAGAQTANLSLQPTEAQPELALVTATPPETTSLEALLTSMVMTEPAMLTEAPQKLMRRTNGAERQCCRPQIATLAEIVTQAEGLVLPAVMAALIGLTGGTDQAQLHQHQSTGHLHLQKGSGSI